MTLTDETLENTIQSLGSECCDKTMHVQLVSRTADAVELMVGFETTPEVSISLTVPNAACNFGFGCEDIVCDDS